MAYLAITARITERRRRIAGIGNPHAVETRRRCRFSRGCRCHPLANRAHVAVDALHSLIRVLAARQVRAPRYISLFGCLVVPIWLWQNSQSSFGGCRSFDCCCGSFETASPWNAWHVIQLAPALYVRATTWSCHCVRLFLPRPRARSCRSLAQLSSGRIAI